MLSKPAQKPRRPFFASGPTVKHPGWDVSILKNAPLGRSHRHAQSMVLIRQMLEKIRQILEIPEGYKIALMAGGATGAMESVLWSLLGPKAVDVFAWDVFGGHWRNAVRDQLHLQGQDFTNPSELAHANPNHDRVFTWNGSTSGMCVPFDVSLPKGDGLMLCDATSAAFAVPLPWDQLDAVGFSWQKGLGGEGAHGMLVLSPRAVARLNSYTPPWPMPRLYQLTKDGTFAEGLFDGLTTNTPSLMCVSDFLDALTWAEKIGGAANLYKQTQQNAAIVNDWVAHSSWAQFRVTDPTYRSPVTVCLDSKESWYQDLAESQKRTVIADLCALLDQEGAAYDIRGHVQDTPSIRLWCGPTVEKEDVEALLPWLDWGYAHVKSRQC